MCHLLWNLSARLYNQLDMQLHKGCKRRIAPHRLDLSLIQYDRDSEELSMAFLPDIELFRLCEKDG